MVNIDFRYDSGIETKAIPTGWEDVTFRQYVELLRAEHENELPFEDRLRLRLVVLCGLDDDTIDQLPVNMIEHLAAMLLFSFNPNLIPYNVPDEWKDFDVADLPWKKLIAVKLVTTPIMAKYQTTDELSDEEKSELSKKLFVELYMVGDVFAREFAGVEILDKPVTEVHWMPAFFLPKFLSSSSNSLIWQIQIQESLQTSTNH